MLRTLAIALMALTISALPVHAQVTAPWTENFDTGGPGWTFSNSSSEGVGWAVDSDPGITLVGNGSGGPGTGGPVIAGMSLNYNDGTDYEEDISLGANKGTATSPVIDVSGLGTSIYVSFDLNFETDFYLSGDSSLDILQLDILDSTETTLFGSLTIGDNTTPVGQPYFLHAGPMGTFLRVGFDVGLFTGLVPAIKLRFVFSTSDDTNNAFNGYFIDNLQVCSDTIAPSAPTNVSPPDGAVVTGGPGVPLTLDWTDSVDSTDCGPGAIWLYFWQVYDAVTLVIVSSGLEFGTSTTITAGLPAGDYLWDVQSLDGSLFFSPLSTQTAFTVEPALPPLSPDTLFVNESADGAQSGDSGFVDPVVDQQPALSAIYRDANTADFAHGYRLQISQDPAFLVLDYDSLAQTLGTPLAKDSRCPDLGASISLVRDTVYYWRVQFTDAASLTGPFSAPQTFRIGDDFDFGVRVGSSHRSRHGCWVATSAWGGVTGEVRGLQQFRSDVLERSGAGSWFSRAYHTAGAPVATAVSAARAPFRAAMRPAAFAASNPVLSSALCVLLLGTLAAAFARRIA